MNSDPAIIEAAARALRDNLGTRAFEAEHAAKIVLAAVTPLLRAAVLEEAAKAAEEFDVDNTYTVSNVVFAIRALKEQP